MVVSRHFGTKKLDINQKLSIVCPNILRLKWVHNFRLKCVDFFRE